MSITRRTACALIPASLFAATEVDTGPDSAYYSLTSTPDGELLLSWIEADPQRTLFCSRLSGSSWSARQVVARDPQLLLNWADFPSLCALSRGRLAAHWLVRHPVEKFATSLRIGFSPDGGKTWQTVFQAGEKLTDDYAGFVSLTPTRNGFAAVYLAPSPGSTPTGGHGDHDANLKTLRWVEFNDNGDVRSQAEIDPDVCSCCQTSVVLTSAGPVAAYRDHTGPRRDISITRRVNGRWSQPQPLGSDRWEINACPVNGPALDVRGRDVVAAWFTGAQDHPRVQVAFSSDAGATFRPAVRVDGGQPIGRVGVLRLNDGSAVVSWLERGPSGTATVRLRRAHPDGGAGAHVDVAAVPAARTSGFPRIAGYKQYVAVAFRSNRVRTSLVPLSKFS